MSCQYPRLVSNQRLSLPIYYLPLHLINVDSNEPLNLSKYADTDARTAELLSKLSLSADRAAGGGRADQHRDR
jgi:hypothetical protein